MSQAALVHGRRRAPRARLLLLAVLAVAGHLPVPDTLADPVSYSRRVWQSADGLPEDLAQAVTQTQDGYLWIGTSGGLVRSDGSRFVVFNHENEPAFVDDSVYSLLTARDGTLWAGTEGGGLIRHRSGEFRHFGRGEGLSDGFVRVVFEDRARRLWVGTDGGLFRMEGGSFVRQDARGGLPAMNVHSICQDRSGRVLVGGTGLIVFDTTGRPTYFSSRESMADGNVRALRETQDGAIWIATISGLRRLPDGIRGDPFAAPKIVRDTNTCVLLESRGGTLWVGTYGRGVMRYDRGRVEWFRAPWPLPHDNVLALFEDGEENVWVGSQGGLLRLSPSAASTITPPDGVPLSINSIYADPLGGLFVAALNGRLLQVSARTLASVSLPSAVASLPIRNVFRDSRGRRWLGTDGQGAVALAGTEVARYTTKQGLANDFVRAFAEDRRGRIWIGTDGGLSRWQAGAIRDFSAGLIYRSVRSLLVDRPGRLWVATEGGLCRIDGDAFAADPLLDRLRGRKVWALYEDAEGGLWIGTQGSGLYLLKHGALRQFATRQGLASNTVLFIGEDRRGRLWMSGPNGVQSVVRRDLEALGADGNGELAVRVYTTADGLSTNQMRGGVQPAGALLPSGELWLPSTRGAVRIAPEGSEREAAAPVLVEQVLADDRDVGAPAELRLPPGEGKLEIHYTAISLRSPERIRFKYRLEGFERDWTAAGQRRVAYYTNLPAGRYRFHVMAYEMSAPTKLSERVLSLEWRPHFYETGWFAALCVGVVAVAAFGSYRLHVRNLRRRFAAVLDERGRLAREMHDTLLQGCVGISTLLEAASRAREVSPAVSEELIARARSEVRSAVDEARMTIWNLRNDGERRVELVPELSRLVDKLVAESGIPVRLETSGTPLALGAEVQRSVMLLAREALQNAIRHAAPRTLRLLLRFERRRLHVEIEDDGCGFDPSVDPSAGGHHYGLIGMRERVERLGGEFSLTSAPGAGTRVRLSIPVPVRPSLEE